MLVAESALSRVVVLVHSKACVSIGVPHLLNVVMVERLCYQMTRGSERVLPALGQLQGIISTGGGPDNGT